MPKGKGKGATGSDEAVFDNPYATEYDVPGATKDEAENEMDKIEDEREAAREEGYMSPEFEAALDRAVDKQKARVEQAEPPMAEPEYVPEPEPAPAPIARPKAGEPVYLYLKTGLGTYTIVDQTFPSKAEAKQFAEANFPNEKLKIMTQKDIDTYMAKQQARAEKVEETVESAKRVGRQVKTGAKRVAGGFVRASEDVAYQKGMHRAKMEPRIRQAWGVQPYPGQKPQPIQPQPQEPQPQEQQRPRMGFQQPQQRRPRMNFGPPPQQKRTRINIPQQKRTRLNIPMGGNVFQPRGFRPRPPGPQKSQKPRGQHPQQKPMRFNFDGLHSARPNWVGRQPKLRQPYEEIEEVKKKTKRYVNKKSNPKKKRKK